ncbi:hypothetical protein [Allokutzneria albata]|uniref:Uncharacterized protein n=1 Tax=Allokutzneria albata TaxID=211114 RepID=A0A1G9WUJ4_ALLAB|nr:hypothetical protein [Allokutzneria albata]SDM88264.1 hypothetical protein SAMN04489726_3826 [Allokutzneria albata]
MDAVWHGQPAASHLSDLHTYVSRSVVVAGAATAIRERIGLL